MNPPVEGMSQAPRRSSFSSGTREGDQQDLRDTDELSAAGGLNLASPPKRKVAHGDAPDPRLFNFAAARSYSEPESGKNSRPIPEGHVTTARGADVLDMDSSDWRKDATPTRPHDVHDATSIRLQQDLRDATPTRLHDSSILPSSKSDSDLIDVSKATSEYPGRGRGHLETLLEKTDEDDLGVIHAADGLVTARDRVASGKWSFFLSNYDAKSQPRLASFLLVALLALCLTGSSWLVTGVVAPVLTVAAFWYCLQLMLLERWQTTCPTLTIYTVSGYGVLAEMSGFLVASSLSPLSPYRALLVSLIEGSLLFSVSAPATLRPALFARRILLVVIFTAISRNVACSVIFLPTAVAPFLLYLLGGLVGGAMAQRDVQAGATDSAVSDEVPQHHRRRSAMSSTSSERYLPSCAVATTQGVGEPVTPLVVTTATRGRRTSLPAISANMNRHRHSSGSMPSYEAAVIAEAHGIITEMLANGTLLPPHIISGLRAVAGLLEQPGVTTPSSANATTRIRNGPFVSLSEVYSDTEESPYTGERPNVLPKRFRRSLPLSVLRRMSTSTWTTTTSATGLPTLESEPIRKRSTSFRHTPVTSPGGSRSNSPSPACSPGCTSDTAPAIPAQKQRSLSTIIPSRGSPMTTRKFQRDRQTIGSINIPDIVFSKSVKFNLESPNPSQRDLEGLEAEETQISAQQHLSPAIRRINLTSDYESSESPSNSEYGENAALLDDSSGGSTYVGSEVPRQSSLENNALGRRYRVDNIVYDLEDLEEHALLNQLAEWDFPIFDLYNDMGDRILSQVAFKIFSDVGLFETFKIPTQEFLNYFHTLELGYRDKPYHNRIHAADVLHGVYYLSSQPIPGFVQVAWQESLPKSPRLNQTDAVSLGQTLPNLKMQYENAGGEDDLYGIMGCNLPPLELMALYTAAAMHDYDHPGRTNAFLVATNAPQAILYNDRSVLENHHAAEAWRLLLSRPEFNWLCNLEKSEFKRFRYLVIESILATDLKRHFEIIAEFNSKANDDEAPGLDWTNETDRLMACQMCIKLADINGPCKRKDLHLQWTYRITDEFFEQGDEETALGLPVSPYMDRKNSQLARLQESFINHLVAPLCNAYGESGMLPGRWKLSDEPEDSNPNENLNRPVVHTFENSFPEESVFPVDRMPMPRIESLLTDHLKSNHEMWVSKVKEEERLKEERAEWDSKQTDAEVPSEP